MDSSTNKNMDPLVEKWLNIQVSDSRILPSVCVSTGSVCYGRQSLMQLTGPIPMMSVCYFARLYNPGFTSL